MWTDREDYDSLPAHLVASRLNAVAAAASRGDERLRALSGEERDGLARVAVREALSHVREEQLR